MVLDWRGAPTLSQPADLYSIAATAESRPVTGNPSGKILVAISPTILYGPDGNVADRPYNKALWRAAVDCGAVTSREVWRGDNGYSTRLFDLTKRGMLAAWLKLLDEHFPWADGFHIDYFSAWSWLFPDLAPSDVLWDQALAALATHLRSEGKVVIGQQYHLTNPLCATDGAFVEQSPFAWHYTLEQHHDDMVLWQNVTKFGDKKPRPSFWTYEVRDWQNWPKESLDLVKKWAEEQDVYLCLGRDANVYQG